MGMNGVVLLSFLKTLRPFPRLILRYKPISSLLANRSSSSERVPRVYSVKLTSRLISNQSSCGSSTFPPCTSVTPPHTHSTQSDSLFDAADISIPDPPTTCCMSGCANCVWIEYAKELAEIYKDGGQAAEKVMNAIEDPSLKIFLSLELQEALKK